METLNHCYFSAAAQVDGPVVPCPGYRIFLRAHTKQGYRLPLAQLRQDITEQVPALADLSYQQHLAPLVRRMQVRMEQTLGVAIKSIDVEVQYVPKTNDSAAAVQKNHAA